MNSKSRDYKQLLSVVTVNDEHEKPTMGSKESVGIKFKEVICPELCVKFWFESD